MARTILLLALAAAATLVATPCAAATRGAVSLDSLTFDKVVDGSENVVVKFDKQYPYGDKQDQFKEFCEKASPSKLLVGEIGVQDYGDKENDDLRERFGVKNEDFPVLMLFRAGLKGSPLTFSGDFKADEILRWVKQETGVWIGLQGCLEAYDALAAAVTSKTTDIAEAIKIAKDKAAELTEEAEKKAADIYVRVMEKIKANGGDFVAAETARVQKLLSGKVSDAKKAMLNLRLNILSSFRGAAPDATGKDEL